MASREEVPKWSMLQVNYKREEVTGGRVAAEGRAAAAPDRGAEPEAAGTEV